MPTHVLYIDDSGSKEYTDPKLYDKGGNSRYFVFGAVLISVVESGRLVDKIIAAKRNTFGTPHVEIKSNWLRRQQERERYYLHPYGISEDELTTFVHTYYDIIAASDLQLIGVIVDKPAVQGMYGRPYYAPSIAYDLLVQRVALEHPEVGCVSVVIDDMSGKTPRGSNYKVNLKRQHELLRKHGSQLRKTINCGCLAPGIHFVNSALSHQVQVADVISYNLLRQFRDHGDAWETPPKTANEKLPTYLWFERLAHKFRQGPNRRIQGYGVVKFPLSRRIPWSISDEDE
jgi:hypothetical protein